MMSHETLWEFERAPEPNDIYWENLQVSSIQRVFYGFFSYVLTAVVIALCFGLLTLIKLRQTEYLKEQEGKELSMQEQGFVKAISAIASIVVVVVNTVLVYVIRRFSLSEKHETSTKMNVSVAIKLTIARFLNSSVILVTVSTDSSKWFENGNLVYNATILIIIMAVQQPIVYAMDIPGIIKWIQKKMAMSKGDESTLTQREANVLCEGSAIDVANNIANIINFIMTCIFYSPLIPQAIPIGFVGCFLNYWAFKYMLLRKHKMPDMFSDLMASFFANFMPWIIFTWAISYQTFHDKVGEEYQIEWKYYKWKYNVTDGDIYSIEY